MKKIALVFVVALLLASCSSHVSWSKAMQQKINEYAATSRQQLMPAFERAGVDYPPKDLALLVFKNSKKMQLYAKGEGDWRYIKTYRIYAASGGPGPKLHSGDRQVPEGVYSITGLNPESRFDLSMHINYPNAFDQKYATLDRRSDLGGNIFIHGNRRSIGCIAIGNYAIQQLFPLVYSVGCDNVTVIIAPNDLRRQAPIYGRVHPTWLPVLYANISKALQPYPIPR